MRNPIVALVILSAVCGACSPEVPTLAGDDQKLVYGADDRKEVSVSPAAEQTAAKAVAILLSKATSVSCSGESCTLLSAPFANAFSPWTVCSSEPFQDQNTVGFCTGFLVGPDLVATAGHCVTSQADCEGIALHFKFEQPMADTVPTLVPAADVYSCKTLVDRIQTPTDDWAVIQLDRPVTDTLPLCIRRSGQPALDSNIEVIGHPYALPKKVAAGAQVKSVADTFFSANLDTYGGNSGSPVFDLATLEVQGILVRGNQDFVEETYDSGESCIRSNVCSDYEGCNGAFEEISQVTRIANLVPVVDCYAPAGGGCETFTGTLSSQTKSRTHELGAKKDVTVNGTLACAAGSTADYDLYLEVYQSKKWKVVAQSVASTCVDRISYSVGATAQRLRWRVQRYTGLTDEAYTLSSCPQ